MATVIGFLKCLLQGVQYKKHGYRNRSVFLEGLRELMRLSISQVLREEQIKLLKLLDVELLRFLKLITDSASYRLAQCGVV